MAEVIKSEFGNFETGVDENGIRFLRFKNDQATLGVYSCCTWIESRTEELVKLLYSTIPVEIGCNTAAPATTNLDFWQAYQAMRNGERVGHWRFGANVYFEYESGKIWMVEGGRKEELKIDCGILNMCSYFIVPKGPRYKVGDRFCYTDFKHEYKIVIVYAEEKTDEFVGRLYKDEKYCELATYTEARLNEFRKIPN